MKISSSHVVYAKYAGLVLAIVGNFILLTAKGQFHGAGSFIAYNGGLFFTAGLISIYAFRLWDVEMNDQTVIVSRFNQRIEFNLTDIRRIDVTPNVIMRNSGPPFVNIILSKEIEGRTEFKYFPSSNRLDEHLLIEPWKKIYREWAQQSMKRRGARR